MGKTEVIAIAFILTGILLITHHYIFWQEIADLEDILHHEFFEAIFFTAGTTLLVSSYHKKRRQS